MGRKKGAGSEEHVRLSCFHTLRDDVFNGVRSTLDGRILGFVGVHE
jgi:hypothetical protein